MEACQLMDAIFGYNGTEALQCNIVVSYIKAEILTLKSHKFSEVAGYPTGFV
jgi:hypothetical protein